MAESLALWNSAWGKGPAGRARRNVRLPLACPLICEMARAVAPTVQGRRESAGHLLSLCQPESPLPYRACAAGSVSMAFLGAASGDPLSWAPALSQLTCDPSAAGASKRALQTTSGSQGPLCLWSGVASWEKPAGKGRPRANAR